MTGLPAAVAQRIADTTGLDPRLGRRARAGACRGCSAPVIRGLDEDMCAFLVEADPHRLTPLGELQAALTGRATFTLGGRPPQLLHRDRNRIRGNSPELVVVLAEHKCGAVPLDAYPDEPPAAIRTKGSDVPPF